MSKMGFQDAELTTPEHDGIMEKLTDHGFQAFILGQLSGNAPKEFVVDVFFEVPLTTGNGYTVGVLDAKFIVHYRKESIDPKTGAKEVYDPHLPLYIEIKPSVHSFGETMRQINVYKSHLGEYLRGMPFILLLGKDTRFRAMFESQGVKVIVASDYEPAPAAG